MLQLFSGVSYQDQGTALWRVEQLLPCFAIAALMSLLRTTRNYCVRVRDTDTKPRKFQIVISAPLFVFLSCDELVLLRLSCTRSYYLFTEKLSSIEKNRQIFDVSLHTLTCCNYYFLIATALTTVII